MNRDMLETISAALADSMAEQTHGHEWAEVYGLGKGPRRIEVALTKNVARRLNGVGELSSADRIVNFPHSKELTQAFSEIARLSCMDGLPSIDSYFPEYSCFWEAKVSKLDLEQGRRGGRALYDIGQWSSDLARLLLIGKSVPSSSQVYSIVLITKFSETDWVNGFKEKIRVELDNDLARDLSEFMEHGFQSWRKLQLRTLIALLTLSDDQFHVIPKDRWAVISIDLATLRLSNRG